MTVVNTDPKRMVLICLLLTLGTFALYWPVTTHPFILYDDGIYITGNHHVTTGLSRENVVWAFKNGEAANWHPLTWLSHQLDCSWFGLKAGAHHFTSLFFHVINTLLVFAFLCSATSAVWRSALLAALFAWHPLHVESVAWASERKDVLSTFFWLLTLMAYVHYTRLACSASSRSSFFYGLALVLFACGLMSKPMVVTLPFVLLLLDFWPLNRIAISDFRSRQGLRLAVEKIPFFLLSAAGSLVTYLVQTSAGALWATPWPERFANAAIAYERYLFNFFIPTRLAITYSHPQHWPVSMALEAIALLALVTVPILLHSRHRPYLLVGWLWFLGALVPTIGLVQVGAQSMADRYTYIPSIGFFIVIVWGGWEFFSVRSQGRILFQSIAGAALLGCLWLTSIQISYWRSDQALFLHAIEVSPDNYIAENCLGKAFENEGELTRALALYRNAVELEPRYPQSQFNYALALLAYGDRDEALKHLQAAARLEPSNPDIQFDLGMMYLQAGDKAAAVEHLGKAAALHPASVIAQYNLGVALARQGDFAGAAVRFHEAIRLQPGFPTATEDLKNLLAAHSELK